ncbi:hypothetical protein X943_000419 [Babesia divergens]|uniref:Uncharacterized protein n=1 Tax=Babesia divergens TaxID=32595 RepID=A0AAD9GF59_BABDI|nr:hypothetical protein X943_000419 [Babesia divergens]
MDRSGFEPETFRMQSGRDTPTPSALTQGRAILGHGTYVEDNKLKSTYLGRYKTVRLWIITVSI